ncbi:hypothetical protein [Paraglaciecola sp. L1A13]|uniref:hypothetical protein n=1 Tax=Paraglaciecola sp. L1A13 TaxID=2686359 RepID=UPI00131D4336|nr:hypothetical protein [Paraglaciecola sp. L1A13]
MKSFLNIVALLALTSSAAAIANTINSVECFDCSYSQRNAKANTWAMQNISNSSLGIANAQSVNIVDLSNREISTFKVWKQMTTLPPPHPSTPLPYTSAQNTPEPVQNHMDALITAFSNLKSKADSIVFPTSPETGIIDAWSFVNCAFCQNDVNTFLNESMYGELRAAELTLVSIAEAFGLIQTSISDSFKIGLESGGELIIKLTILADSSDGDYLEVEIVEVIDADNNSVPQNAAGLSGLNIRVGSENQANHINLLIGAFGYFIPVRTGVVTIKDCGGANLPACSGGS